MSTVHNISIRFTNKKTEFSTNPKGDLQFVTFASLYSFIQWKTMYNSVLYKLKNKHEAFDNFNLQRHSALLDNDTVIACYFHSLFYKRPITSICSKFLLGQ